MFLPSEGAWIDCIPLDVSSYFTSLVTGQSPLSHESVTPEDTRDKKSPEGKARQRLDLASRSVFNWFFLTYPFPSLSQVCCLMPIALLSWARGTCEIIESISWRTHDPFHGLFWNFGREGGSKKPYLTPNTTPTVTFKTSPFWGDCKDILHKIVFILL